MDLHNSVVLLFLMTLICHSYEISTTGNPLPVFEAGHTINLLPSSLAFQGESSLRGVISPNAGLDVVVDTRSVPNASFLIFQVHSYVKPLVLSSTSTLVNGGHINGTDIGLYSKLDLKLATFYIFNHNSKPVNLLMVPMLYKTGDPVPGGCNLSFMVNIAPFMTLTYENDSQIVQVDTQAASAFDQLDCSPLGLTYEVYELPLKDTSADSYFDGILSVVTDRGADLNGIQTRKPLHQPELRRRFANYPGFGSIYVVTVRDSHTGMSSAYVPIAKYNCIDENYTDCSTYQGSVWLLSIAAVVFIVSEINYVLGGDIQVFTRSVFIMCSAITIEPALPSSLRWIFIGFFCLAVGILFFAGLLKQALVIFTDHTYALVTAHILFGIFLYGGLATLPGFQDWLVVMYTFGIFFLVFYILQRLFPNHSFDQTCGIFFHLAILSAATNGVLFYVYVDPSRILQHEFTDVIFSPPASLSDHMLMLSWPVVSAAYLVGRRAIRLRFARRDYDEFESPPPYSPERQYRSM